MNPAFLLVAAVASGVLLLTIQLFRYWLRWRGTRVVTCPENQRKVGVEVDARHAAFTGLYTGPALRLSSCTRWPERQGCGQACLSEIAQAGQGCLVRTLLSRWYEAKDCAYCGKPIGEIDWGARKPALLTPGGTTIDWAQVNAEHLDEVLATHRPVCFACHVTNTFARAHPELLVDRSARNT